MPRRFPAPWRIVDTGSAFRVTCADGLAVAYLYYGDQRATGTGLDMMTRDEARRVALGITRLPELLGRSGEGG